jgi:hypothetical protein
MNKLNHRPRKTLNFKTPYAVFFAETLQEAAWRQDYTSELNSRFGGNC